MAYLDNHKEGIGIALIDPMGIALSKFTIFLLALTVLSSGTSRAQTLVSGPNRLPNDGYLDHKNHVTKIHNEQKAIHALRTTVIKDLLNIRISLKKALGHLLRKDEYKTPELVKIKYANISEVKAQVKELDEAQDLRIEGVEREIFQRFSVISWSLMKLDAEMVYLSSQMWQTSPEFKALVDANYKSILDGAKYKSGPGFLQYDQLFEILKKKWIKFYGVDKRLSELLVQRDAILEQYPFLSMASKMRTPQGEVVEVAFYQSIYDLYRKGFAFPDLRFKQETKQLKFTDEDIKAHKDSRGVFNYVPVEFNKQLEAIVFNYSPNDLFPYEDMWKQNNLAQVFKAELLKNARLRLKHNTQLINDLLSFDRWETGLKGVSGNQYTLLLLANSPRYWQMTTEQYQYLNHYINWTEAQDRISGLLKKYNKVKDDLSKTLKIGGGVLMLGSIVVSNGTSVPLMFGGIVGTMTTASGAAFAAATILDYYDAQMAKDYAIKTFYGTDGISKLSDIKDSMEMSEDAFRNLVITMMVYGIPSKIFIETVRLAARGFNTSAGMKVVSIAKNAWDNTARYIVTSRFARIVKVALGGPSKQILAQDEKLAQQFATIVEEVWPGIFQSLKAKDNPVIRERIANIYQRYVEMQSKAIKTVVGPFHDPRFIANWAREMIVETAMTVGLEYVLRGPEKFEEEQAYVMINVGVGWGIITGLAYGASEGATYTTVWSSQKRFDFKNKSRWKQFGKNSLLVGAVALVSSVITTAGIELHQHYENSRPDSELWDIGYRVALGSAIYGSWAAISSPPRAQWVMGWFKPRLRMAMRNAYGWKAGKQYSNEGMYWMSILNNSFGTGASISVLRASGVQSAVLSLDEIPEEVLADVGEAFDGSYVYRNDVSWGKAFGF